MINMYKDNRKIQIRLVPDEGGSGDKLLQYRLYPKTWFGRVFNSWKFLLHYDYCYFTNLFGAKWGEYCWCRIIVLPDQWDMIKEIFQTMQDIKDFQTKEKRKEYEVRNEIIY